MKIFCKLCLQSILATDWKSHISQKQHLQQLPSKIVFKGLFKQNEMARVYEYLGKCGGVRGKSVTHNGDEVSIECRFWDARVYSEIIHQEHSLFGNEVEISWYKKTKAGLLQYVVQDEKMRKEKFVYRKLAIINSLKELTTFEEQFTLLQNKLKIPKTEKEAHRKIIHDDITSSLTSGYPDSMIYFFGSTTTDLDIHDSDLNIYIDNTDSELATLEHMKNLITESNLFTQISLNIESETPTIRCEHKKTKVCCEVNIRNELPVGKSELIKFYLTLDEKLRHLMVLIKFWADCCDLRHENAFSSYAICLMVLFYLQQDPYKLPSVANLQKDIPPDEVDGWNCTFGAIEFTSSDLEKATIFELMVGFFEFYSNFDYMSKVVSPYLGSPIEKVCFLKPCVLPGCFEDYLNQDNTFFTNSGICIQDVFEHSKNVSLSVDITSTGKFTAMCRKSLELVRSDPKEILYKLLFTPDETLHEFSIEKDDYCDEHEWMSRIRAVVLRILKQICSCNVVEKFEDTNVIYSCTGSFNIWNNRFEVLKNLIIQFSLDLKTTNNIEKEVAVTTHIINNASQNTVWKMIVLLKFDVDPCRVRISFLKEENVPLLHIQHFVYVQLVNSLKDKVEDIVRIKKEESCDILVPCTVKQNLIKKEYSFQEVQIVEEYSDDANDEDNDIEEVFFVHEISAENEKTCNQNSDTENVAPTREKTSVVRNLIETENVLSLNYITSEKIILNSEPKQPENMSELENKATIRNPEKTVACDNAIVSTQVEERQHKENRINIEPTKGDDDQFKWDPNEIENLDSSSDVEIVDIQKIEPIIKTEVTKDEKNIEEKTNLSADINPQNEKRNVGSDTTLPPQNRTGTSVTEKIAKESSRQVENSALDTKTEAYTKTMIAANASTAETSKTNAIANLDLSVANQLLKKNLPSFAQQVHFFYATFRTFETTLKTRINKMYADLFFTLKHNGFRFYGSSILHEYISNSDINTHVWKYSFGILFQLLLTSHKFTDVATINENSIKCVHSATNQNLMLTTTGEIGVYTHDLALCYLDHDEKLRFLLALIKHWAYCCNLIKHITGDMITLMVIFYLQVEHKLPSVANLQKRCNSNFKNNWNVAFSKRVVLGFVPRASILDLVKGFFKFYGDFDFFSMVVTPFFGTPVAKTRFLRPTILPEEYLIYKNQREELAVDEGMCIQCPFEHTRNVAVSVGYSKAATFATLCRHAFDRMQRSETKMLADLLGLFGETQNAKFMLVQPANVPTKKWLESVEDLTVKILTKILGGRVLQAAAVAKDTTRYKARGPLIALVNRVKTLKKISKDLRGNRYFDQEIAVTSHILQSSVADEKFWQIGLQIITVKNLRPLSVAVYFSGPLQIRLCHFVYTRILKVLNSEENCESTVSSINGEESTVVSKRKSSDSSGDAGPKKNKACALTESNKQTIADVTLGGYSSHAHNINGYDVSSKSSSEAAGAVSTTPTPKSISRDKDNPKIHPETSTGANQKKLSFAQRVSNLCTSLQTHKSTLRSNLLLIDTHLKPLLKHINFRFYGSSVTGLHMCNSNVNIHVDDLPKPVIHKLSFSNEIFTNVTVNYPTGIECVHYPTQLCLKLTTKAEIAVYSSQLIHYYLSLDDKFPHLATIVKHWARCSPLKGTLFTKYMMELLVVFYLQVEYKVPSVVQLQNNCTIFVNGWNCAFSKKVLSLPKTVTMYELVCGFFKFYGDFDYFSLVVAPFFGAPVSKTRFVPPVTVPEEYWIYMNQDQQLEVAAMCVQCPFEHSKNVAVSVSSTSAAVFATLCRKACDRMDLPDDKILGDLLMFQEDSMGAELSLPKPEDLTNETWIDFVKDCATKVLVEVLAGQIEQKSYMANNTIKYFYTGPYSVLDDRIATIKNMSGMLSNVSFLEKEVTVTSHILQSNRASDTMHWKLELRITPEENPSRVLLFLNGTAEICNFMYTRLVRVLNEQEKPTQVEPPSSLESKSESVILVPKSCTATSDEKETPLEKQTSVNSVNNEAESISETKVASSLSSGIYGLENISSTSSNEAKHSLVTTSEVISTDTYSNSPSPKIEELDKDVSVSTTSVETLETVSSSSEVRSREVKDGVSSASPSITNEDVTSTNQSTSDPKQVKLMVLQKTRAVPTFAQQTSYFCKKILVPKNAIEMNHTIVEQDVKLALFIRLNFGKVFFFGSSVMGLFGEDNKFAMFVDKLEPRTDIIKECLVVSGKFYEVITLPGAQIINCRHKKTKIECEIHMMNRLYVLNSRLIEYYLTLDPKMPQLFFLIKNWAKNYKLQKASSFSNYALYLMIIFFLQQKPYKLPPVRKLQADATPDCVDGWNGAFTAIQFNSQALTDATVKDLLVDFFKFYATFDYFTYVIAPYVGLGINKASFLTPFDLPPFYQNLVERKSTMSMEFDLWLQDPFEHTRNVTASVNLANMGRFAALCRSAFQLMFSSEKQLLYRLMRQCQNLSIVDYYGIELKKKDTWDPQHWLETVKSVMFAILTKILCCNILQVQEKKLNDSEGTQKIVVANKIRTGDIDQTLINCVGLREIWKGRINILKSSMDQVPPGRTCFGVDMFVSTFIKNDDRRTAAFDLSIEMTFMQNPMSVRFVINEKDKLHFTHFIYTRMVKALRVAQLAEQISNQLTVSSNATPLTSTTHDSNNEHQKNVKNPTSADTEQVQVDTEDKEVHVDNFDSKPSNTSDATTEDKDDHVDDCDSKPCKTSDASGDEVSLTDIKQPTPNENKSGNEDNPSCTEKSEVSEEEGNDDVPADFFEDFAKEDFLDGFNISDSRDEKKKNQAKKLSEQDAANTKLSTSKSQPRSTECKHSESHRRSRSISRDSKVVKKNRCSSSDSDKNNGQKYTSRTRPRSKSRTRSRSRRRTRNRTKSKTRIPSRTPSPHKTQISKQSSQNQHEKLSSSRDSSGSSSPRCKRRKRLESQRKSLLEEIKKKLDKVQNIAPSPPTLPTFSNTVQGSVTLPPSSSTPPPKSLTLPPKSLTPPRTSCTPPIPPLVRPAASNQLRSAKKQICDVSSLVCPPLLTSPSFQERLVLPESKEENKPTKEYLDKLLGQQMSLPCDNLTIIVKQEDI